jgi:UDP:flavonoid glycosyltransferase YjiC (YdhE family)
LVPDDWPTDGRYVYGFSVTGMPFADLLASCDALVTKPGYGSFVEAAVAGVPVLHLPRPDWPETPHLVRWLRRNARALEIDEDAWHAGGIEAALERLWAQPQRPPIRATGAQVVARRLRELLG